MTDSIEDHGAVVSVAARPSRSLWVLWHILLALIGNAALAVAVSGLLDFIAGSRNASGGFANLPIAVLLCGVWLVCLVAQTVGLIVTAKRPSGRSSRLACMLLTVVSFGWCPGSCTLRILPHDAYERGFRQWALKNIDVSALRAWHATLPVLPSIAVVPPNSWPSHVSLTAPATVESLPNGTGVLLQWGRLAAWGDSRKVFVGANAGSSPPPDIHHEWKQVAPGVFIACQDPG